MGKEGFIVTTKGHAAKTTQVTAAAMEHLRSLPSLQTVEVHAPEFASRRIGTPRRPTQVQELDLEGIPLTDDGLAHLAGLVRLRILNLGNTRLTDAGLEHLGGLVQLQSLDLNHTQVTDAGLAHRPRLDRPPESRPKQHANHGRRAETFEALDPATIPRPLRHSDQRRRRGTPPRADATRLVDTLQHQDHGRGVETLQGNDPARTVGRPLRIGYEPRLQRPPKGVAALRRQSLVGWVDAAKCSVRPANETRADLSFVAKGTFDQRPSPTRIQRAPHRRRNPAPRTGRVATTESRCQSSRAPPSDSEA